MNCRKRFYLVLIFYSLSTNFSFILAQEALIGETNVLHFKSTSDKYNSYVLQNHQGLPRFGVLDNYSKPPEPPKPGVRPTKGNRDPVARKKNKAMSMGHNIFYQLLNLKYLAPAFDDIDPNRIVNIASDNDQKQIHSAIAQRQITSNISSLATEKLVLQYFCNPEDPRSNNCDALAVGSTYKGGSWGGAQANEFAQLRNYKAFVKEELGPLRAWARTVFPSDHMDMYYVATTFLGEYDFEKKGYWISLRFNGSEGSGKSNTYFFRNLKAQQGYENSIMNFLATKRARDASVRVFVSLPASAAERLIENGIRSLYVVKKVRVTYKDLQINGYQAIVNFEYNHLGPQVELFEDMALTKKIGSISLDNIPLEKP